MASKSLSKRLLFIPAALGAVFAALYLIPAWANLEFGVYDLFMHLKPPIKEDASIVLLDVDDISIEKGGTWPWPRGLVARGLEALTEFRSAYTVFDIEYVNESPMTVDKAYLETALKSRFENDFHEIQAYTTELFNSVTAKKVSISDLQSFAQDLYAEINNIGDTLYDKTRLVAIPNDAYLGKAMKMFGKSFVTIRRLTEKPRQTDPRLDEITKKAFAYPGKIVGTENIPLDPENNDMPGIAVEIPIIEVSSKAAGAGFTNVPIDKDGKRRRIQLLTLVDGIPHLQLAFAPLLDSLGNPELDVKKGRIDVKGAKFKDGSVRDFSIPVDNRGMMLINWPSKDFERSFDPHVSFYKLIDYKEKENDLIRFLSSLARNEIWNLVPGANPVSPLLELWNTAETTRETALEEGTPEASAAYATAKDDFHGALAAFVSSERDETLARGLLAKAKESDTPENGPLYDNLDKKIAEDYRAIRELGKTLAEIRAELAARLKGAYCVIGWTASISTDLGVNPFSKQYANVGTHASILNTVLQGKFLRETPVWVSMILSVALSLGLILAIRKLKTSLQIAVGIGATVLLFASSYAFFAVGGVFIPTVSPVLAVFTSFLSYSLAVFFLSEKEKSFLKKAFSTYLSNDIIAELVNDPTMLKLGGDKRWISAMFTDVKGFSTISEQLDPVQLVSLLNFYLSGMSDIILENGGTIDKYEGDAIIAFFGAPIANPDHARAMCRSALGMRRKEAEMNVKVLEEKLSPVPLLTRIGLNTGDMVVGNMGTQNKMNYTIMGNAVNLAARLEGVNKKYGSWILTTEYTVNETGDEFLWRKFDRVRVVGINTPVRLYELVTEASGAGSERVELVERFDAALDLFERRDYEAAKASFTALSERFPDDGPARHYVKACDEMRAKNPGPEWDGVFNLTEK